MTAVDTGELLAIFVPGLPAPQGSKRYLGSSPGGRPRAVESSKRVKPWRHDVMMAAAEAYGREHPSSMPVAVTLAFAMPRPASHYLPASGRRPEPVLRPEAPLWPAKKPDVDKLSRAILDALKAGSVYMDDGQVCDLRASKVYVAADQQGVHIHVRELLGGADG